MKKLLFLSIFLLGIYTSTAQNYYMTKPEGYGAAATGGGNATPVTVTTYTDFVNQIKSTGSKVILVSGTINATYASVLVTNKTIIGLPGARFINNNQTTAGSGILNLKSGSNNVIIRNLIFEGPGAYDNEGRDHLTADGCTNLWVDHCEFQDGMDGNFDIKGLSDKITVSWCKFTYLKTPKPGGSGGTDDHRFTNVIGSDEKDAPADKHYSVTFQNCYWANGCRERMPRARNAELHILNCYYNTNAPSSVALGLAGGANNNFTSCYVEKTNFALVKTVFKSYTKDDGGTVRLLFDDCLKGVANVGTAPTKPTYSYTTMPVADVATYVPNTSCGAGATLSVTAAGVISSSCTNLGVENYAQNGIKVYPTLVDTTLNVDLSDTISGDATINIFTTSGQKVFSSTKNNVSSAEKLSFNLTTLSEGLYLCTVTIAETTTTFKFVKK